jgi:hypothetical protein
MVTVGLLFGLLMILWGIALIGGMAGWPGPWLQGSAVLQWVLFALVGWKIFGPLIQG